MISKFYLGVKSKNKTATECILGKNMNKKEITEYYFKRRGKQIEKLEEILELIFVNHTIISCEHDYSKSDEDCQYFLRLDSSECNICKKYYDYKKKYKLIKNHI